VDLTGTFTISLDFELLWGMRNRRRAEAYTRNVLGVRQVIPRLLELFERYGIHCTWATVGFLFFDDKEDLLGSLPERLPNYADPALSTYPLLDRIGPDERRDPCHYGLSLIRRIEDCPHQEIGTHTFSHFYCLEAGQTPEDFRADLEAALGAAARRGITLRSLVFPRNQFSRPYLRLCADCGIDVVRGNQSAWIYQYDWDTNESLAKRSVRRLDQYLPLTGNNCVLPEQDPSGVLDVSSSRFLLPASSQIRTLSSLCLHRVCRSMSHAARTGGVYHLWWHPHNFGTELEANIRFLTRIFEHFRRLSETRGMVARGMAEVADATRAATASAPGGNSVLAGASAG
jgi:peptidoglycan/xylan/chitin deacetylase (PgdA/CDA1 family)